MANKVAGKMFVKINGDQLAMGGTFSCNFTPELREAVTGLSGIVGYKETPEVPYVEGDCYYTTDIDLAAIHALTDATITVELANGKVGVLRNAWSASRHEVDTAEGTFPVRFEGLSGDWF